MKSTNNVLALPDDWHERKGGVVNDILRIWEQSHENGTDLSAREICPDAPNEILEQADEGIECLKIFNGIGGALPSDDDALFHAENYRAGHYLAESVIDEGGQGVILRAYDAQLGRTVALKILKEKGILDRAGRARLEREAKIIGNLEHPGVIPVYGFGRDADGNPYYAMRHMPQKRTLKHAIDEVHNDADQSKRTIGFQQLLQNFITVCETIKYAHSKDVIHRDLKPANILVGDFGEVFVLDFGIAKSLDCADETAASKALMAANDRDTQFDSHTKVGAMGTPAYMSPEQAENAASVGKSSDIYALGATLYHLLTGEAPFVSTMVDEDSSKVEQADRKVNILDRVKSGDLPASRQVNPSVPPALDAICTKAMSKDPRNRYESAGALADEIRRYVADETVEAYPDPIAAKVRRWMKRHQTIVTGAAAAVLVAVLVLSITSQQLATANGKTKDALKEANTQKSRAQEAETAERLRAEELDKANVKLKSFLRTTYLNEFQVANTAWLEMDVRRAESILDRWTQQAANDEDLRSFEWSYLKGLCQSELPTLREFKAAPDRMSVSRNGQRLIVRQDNTPHLVSVIDPATGKTLYETETDFFLQRDNTATVSPDGRKLATIVEMNDKENNPILFSTWREIVVRDLDSEEERRIKLPDVNQGGTFVMEFHNESAELLILLLPKVADLSKMHLELQRWNIAAGTMISAVDLGSLLQTGTFSPDGKLIALWDLTPADTDEGFVPEDVRIHDAESGEKLTQLSQHAGLIYDATFSANGTYLATASEDTTVKLWDVASGKLLTILQGHTDEVKSVTFSPDGTHVASAGVDRAIRIWDRATGRLLYTLRGHTGAVNSLVFVSDKQLVSAGQDGFVLAWQVGAQGVESLNGFSGVMQVAFSPDGNQLFSSHMAGPGGKENAKSIRVTDLAKENLSDEIPVKCEQFQLSPNGEQIAAYTGDGAIEIWSVANKTKLRTIDDIYRWHHPFAISPDGKRLATVSAVEEVKPQDKWTEWEASEANDRGEEFKPFWLTVNVVDVETGQVVHALKGHHKIIENIAFCPINHQFAVVHRDDMKYHLSIWDYQTGKLVRHIDLEHYRRGFGTDPPIAYSPDGRSLAIGGLHDHSDSRDGKIIIMDSESGTIVQTLTGFKGRDITALAFSADSRRIATTSLGREVKLWDVESGQPVLTLAGVKQLPYVAAFSPDGLRLAVGCGNDVNNGEILIWEGRKTD